MKSKNGFGFVQAATSLKRKLAIEASFSSFQVFLSLSGPAFLMSLFLFNSSRAHLVSGVNGQISDAGEAFDVGNANLTSHFEELYSGKETTSETSDQVSSEEVLHVINTNYLQLLMLKVSVTYIFIPGGYWNEEAGIQVINHHIMDPKGMRSVSLYVSYFVDAY